MPKPTTPNVSQETSAFEISSASTDFPTVLREAHPTVRLLYGLGSQALVQRLFQYPGLAIVGSRQATAQGCADARWFAREASKAGLTIVSGLAQGIDAAAHCGGLEGQGSTIAVLGHGRDTVYPQRHRGLAQRISEEGGCLLTEYPDKTPAIAYHFPNRNRIIAGLSRAVLVVEAVPQSGSLITARHALEQGIDVFAIPGSIHVTQSIGCNMLIRQGAQPVLSPEQLLQDLGVISPPGSRKKNQGEAGSRVSKNLSLPFADNLGRLPQDTNQLLLDQLQSTPQSVEALEAATGMPRAQLYGELLLLELNHLATRNPEGKWLKFRINL
ncbi:MAG: DNA-protecting protein DprA [Burkholderiaceae bacterium]|nr:DNA-protecting protein DprA [Burkholderiaceae bacterium]